MIAAALVLPREFVMVVIAFLVLHLRMMAFPSWTNCRDSFRAPNSTWSIVDVIALKSTVAFPA